jgi:hypothetical protein
MIPTAFQSVTTDARTHRWSRHTHDQSLCATEQLAAWVADSIMSCQCRGCPHHLAGWRSRVVGGAAHSPTHASALRQFVQPVLGLPDGSASVTDDHREGFVAEHLWYALVGECPGTEKVVLVEPPSFSVTSPGGDGLVIHRLDDGSLRFRLWEVKKATGESPVSATVTEAYKQLETRAAIYLAQITATGEGRHASAELADHYGQLVDMWLRGEPGAAAGVAIATSAARLPSTCFTTLGTTRFVQFASPNRLRGMLTALQDFPAFARLVQETVWSGL